MDKSGRIVLVAIFIVGFTLFGVVSKSRRQSDIVIKTATEEFIIDDYHQDDNCIEFNYDGELRSICGDYEIIE
jgi:hypothetical protein